MERTKEIIKKELDLAYEKCENLRQELIQLDLGKIDLKDKYLYLEFNDLYFHVDNFWFTKRSNDRNEYELVLEGESFKGSVSEYSDLTYFMWHQWDQITLYLGSSKQYKEITKEEFENKLDKALEETRKEIKSERQE